MANPISITSKMIYDWLKERAKARPMTTATLAALAGVAGLLMFVQGGLFAFGGLAALGLAGATAILAMDAGHEQAKGFVEAHIENHAAKKALEGARFTLLLSCIISPITLLMGFSLSGLQGSLGLMGHLMSTTGFFGCALTIGLGFVGMLAVGMVNSKAMGKQIDKELRGIGRDMEEGYGQHAGQDARAVAGSTLAIRGVGEFSATTSANRGGSPGDGQGTFRMSATLTGDHTRSDVHASPSHGGGGGGGRGGC